MGHRRPSSALVAGIMVAILATATPVWAAEPGEVATDIRDDGVFVESGSDLSEADAGELVAAVRNQGERFSIVVLTEDPGSGAVTFGDAVVDRLSDPGLIFVLTPDDVAVVGVGDVFTVDEIDAALDVALEAGGSDSEYASNFVEALTGEAVAVTPVPEPVTTDSDSSGGAGGLLWFLVIVAAIGLFIFFMVRRSRSRQETATANELAAARAEIQQQLDAVANDILDMEDEVRTADNDRVDALYNGAGETYQEASAALAGADAPQELLDIANAVDVAVWQLDSAEALLDGKEPPPKPDPKRLEPVAPPAATAPDTGSGPLGLPPRPTFPQGSYSRRSSRRSGGFSPSVLEILITLGAGAMAGRARRRRFPTSRPPARSSGSGGGFLPSPSRRSTSSSRTSRGSSTRRGTGGRIRTGRKRRR
jgi:hypothetical protein